MPGKKQRNTTVNENWEAEIAAYDKTCEAHEREFREHFMVIDQGGHKDLSEDENEVLTLVLNGVSCVEIAKQAQIQPEEVAALLEIIRAKLSVTD